MRNKTSAAIVALLVVTIMLPTGVARAKDGLDYMPAEAQGLVIIRNLSSLYSVLGISDLRSERPELFADFDGEAMEELGFNPLDLAALEGLGLKTGEPIYVGWAPDPSSSVVLMFPGGEDLLSSLKTLLKKQDESFSSLGKDGGVEYFGDDDDEVVFYHDESFLVIVAVVEEDDVIRETPESALAAAKDFRKQAIKKSLKNSDKYLQLTGKLKTRGDVQVYMGPEFSEEVMEWGDSDELDEYGMTEEELTELYERWGLLNSASLVEASFGPDRIDANGYSWFGKKAVIHDWYRTTGDPPAFLRRVPSDPMLLSLCRLNSAALYRSIKEFMVMAETDSTPSFDDQMDDAGKDMGMDIETALIDQINGNIAILINQVQFMGADAVVLLQVADPDAFYDTIDGIAGWIKLSLDLDKSKQDPSGQQQPSAELTEEKFGDVDYYKVMMPPGIELCFGLVEDHLVVTTSVMRFQAIVSGGEGFAETIGNGQISAAVADPTGGVFYINFESLVRDLSMMAPMLGIKDGEVLEILGNLKELSSVSHMDDEGIWTTSTLTSAGPDVWKGVCAWILEEAAEKNAKKLAPDQEDD
jgi:hypothetical protein